MWKSIVLYVIGPPVVLFVVLVLGHQKTFRADPTEFRFAVMPMEVGLSCDRFRSWQTWIPAEEQAKWAFQIALAHAVKCDSRVSRHPKDALIQIQGVGEECLWINVSFLDPIIVDRMEARNAESNWMKFPITVFDGGPKNWTADVHCETGEIRRFFVNN